MKYIYIKPATNHNSILLEIGREYEIVPGKIGGFDIIGYNLNITKYILENCFTLKEEK